MFGCQSSLPKRLVIAKPSAHQGQGQGSRSQSELTCLGSLLIVHLVDSSDTGSRTASAFGSYQGAAKWLGPCTAIPNLDDIALLIFVHQFAVP